jgi:hypothetical protein
MEHPRRDRVTISEKATCAGLWDAWVGNGHDGTQENLLLAHGAGGAQEIERPSAGAVRRAVSA